MPIARPSLLNKLNAILFCMTWTVSIFEIERCLGGRECHGIGTHPILPFPCWPIHLEGALILGLPVMKTIPETITTT